VNHLGQPLKIDGNPGPETRWALAAALQPIERQLAVRRAQRHLGLREDKAPNVDSGGFIAQYLAECGVALPAAYCAAAGSCWLAVPGVRLAGAVRLGQAFPATDEPAFADGAWYPTGGGFGHWELVIGADEDFVMTIGANVQNGIRCVRRARVGLNFSRSPFPVGDGCPPVIYSKAVPLVANGQRAGTR
jgi:hypothetical protein